MKIITIDRAVVEQALEALEMCRLNGSQYLYGGERDLVFSSITALRTALAQEQEQAAQVPPEVAATLTTTDIAWLETRRLTKLWQEFGKGRWAGADEGWDCAIEAVRSRLNDECQDALDWKAAADRSNVTAIELLQKMQGLKDE